MQYAMEIIHKRIDVHFGLDHSKVRSIRHYAIAVLQFANKYRIHFEIC